jgi:hypothetical protein
MRIPLVAVGLVALISTGLAAQVPAQRHSLLPAHQSRLSIDFGLKQALKSLPQRPAVCDKVRKHRHQLLRVAILGVELPFPGRHTLRPVTVPPCPVG